MNILYIANIRVPSEKAHAYQIVKNCEAFARQGSRVTLVYAKRVQTADLKNAGNFWKYYSVRKTFNTISLPCLDLLYCFRNMPLFCIKAAFALQTFTFILSVLLWIMFRRRDSDDVVYTRDMFLALPLLKFKRFFKTALYLESHTFLKKWPPALFKKADGLIVITAQLKKLYRESGVPEERVLVAHDGVDLKNFLFRTGKAALRKKLGLPLKNRVIGYMGRFQTLEKEKGIPELIRALAVVKKGFPDVCLWLIGGPMDRIEAYRKIAFEKGLSPTDVVFMDKVPNSKVPLYLRSFDICAMPFPWSEHYAYFMSPLKMFEYMASGVPVIASDLPSVREVLADHKNAVLFRPGDVSSLARGLVQLLKNRTLGKRIAKQAMMDVKKYDWSKRGGNIVRFLKERSFA